MISTRSRFDAIANIQNGKDMQTLNVMIADDHQLFVESLKLLLALPMEDYDLKVQSIAFSGDDLVQLLQRQRPDLLLLDINLPGKTGLEVLKETRKTLLKGTRILALTMYDDPKIIKQAFDLGANGYLLKSCGKEDFQDAIRTVLSGDIYMDRNVSASGVNQPTILNGQFEDTFQKKFSLTKREVEILRLVVQAQNNQSIADTLFISEQTAAVHRKNIMRKIGVNSTAALIKVAYENSLIK